MGRQLVLHRTMLIVTATGLALLLGILVPLWPSFWQDASYEQDIILGAVISIGLTAIWVAFAASRLGESRWQRGLFVLLTFGLVFRLMMTLALHVYGSALEGDAKLYASHAELLSSAWLRGEFITYRRATNYVVGGPGYVYWNAILFTIFGPTTVVIKLVNTFLGVLSAYVLYLLGRNAFGEMIGIIAACLLIVWPSTALWATQNLKESLTLFLMLVSVYFASLASSREQYPFRRMGLLLMTLSVIALYPLRPAMSLFVVGWILAIVLASRVNLKTSSRNLIGPIIMITGAFFALRQLGLLYRLEKEISNITNIDRLNYLNSAKAHGGSALEVTEFNSIGSLISAIPTTVVNFMFRPFPWEALSGSTLQIISIPESLIWYLFFIASVYGVYVAQRIDSMRFIPLWLMPLIGIIVIAPQYTNLGIAYRHRSLFMPYFFLFASVAIVKCIAGLQRRSMPIRTARFAR